MSENKRAPLMSFGVQKFMEKSVKEPRKTFRIKVLLPESNEDTCPEFNYKDELAKAKKKDKNKDSANVPNGVNSRMFEDDDDVRRIAREMEEKYGTGISSNRKKKRSRKDDYADIGMGYDENDSFIDNTDGYDEMIPQNVTTLHGGFYINSGALEFKTDEKASSELSSTSSSSDDDNEEDAEEDDEEVKKTSRKRVIESSDETDRENKTDVDIEKQKEKKRKLQSGGNGIQQTIKKKLLGQPEKIYIKKRRLLDPQKKTVKELLREKREDLNMTVSDKEDNEIKIEIKTEDENKSNISDTIESVVKASADMNNSGTNNNDNSNNNNIKSNNDDKNKSDNNKNAESSQDKYFKLPENLPVEIIEILSSIKESILKADKNNIFTKSVNSQLLRLERKCKCLGKPSKIKVYENLSLSVGCKAEILIQKAGNLVLEDEQQRLKLLLIKLKNEVDRIMPSLLENHEIESQKVLQRKFSHDANDEENKTLRMPKRRFQWNDLTKKLLKDILLVKKRCFLLEGKQKDALDGQMANFLRSEIQLIWPEGWMSMNALNKIYTTYADSKRSINSTQSQSSTTSLPSQQPSQQPPLPPPLPQSSSSLSTTSTITTTINTSTITASTTTTTTTTPTGTATTTMKVPLSTSTLTTNSLKNLPSFSNSNLSITPILPNVVSTSNTILKNDKDDIIKTITIDKQNKEVECKLKLKPVSELMKPCLVNKSEPPQSFSDDSVIIVDSSVVGTTSETPVNNTLNLSKKDNNDYCQVIDLSDKNDFNKLKSTTLKHQQQQQQSKQSTNCSDDIQKVMEDLKVLQKMSSSPKKCLDASPTSSAVSVIAVNKSFTGKTTTNNNNNQSVMHRVDYMKSNNINDFNNSFQDEFQKQLYTSINHIASNTTKNNFNSIDRYPHIASSASSVVPTDKYFQNSNNNFSQNSNGHKSTSSASQAGSYSILDDMFANLLTQYGYAKEASSASKK